MTIADDARAASFHCEAKLHAFRKSQTGIVVSFILDPADVPQQLALAPLGARYTIALAERGDDEKPISRDPAPQPVSRPLAGPGVSPTATTPTPQREGAHHQKDLAKSMAGKARYAELDEAEQAVARASLLAKDRAFQHWAWVDSEDAAAKFIRRWCGVESRREISLFDRAHGRFIELETDFKMASGHIAEVRG